MYASFHRFSGLEPARIQPMVDDLERRAVPAALAKFGCSNAFVLVDWDAGSVTSVTLWDDGDRMRQHDRETEREHADADRPQQGWRTEPRIERQEIVYDANRFLERGARAAAA